MGPDERKKTLRTMSVLCRCDPGKEECVKCQVDDGGICPRVRNQIKASVKQSN
jgi:hypothetical protein